MKQLTKGQMAVLATYEENLTTAVKGGYVRAMHRTDVSILEGIHNAITGGDRHFNANCQACVHELCSDLGRLYFAQRDAEKEHAESLAAMEQEAAETAAAEEVVSGVKFSGSSERKGGSSRSRRAGR